MVNIAKIENMVAGWLKPMPHLPKGGQKWLAENVWWIVLVGVIASTISLLISIGAIFTYIALVGAYSNVYSAAAYGPGWVIGSIVSLLFSILIIVLLATAIGSLKAGQSKGWDRLFLVLLIKAVAVVIGAVLTLNPIGFVVGILFGAIGVAISAYFTFEIRSHFVAAKAHIKK
jgi:hypothetical protein